MKTTRFSIVLCLLACGMLVCSCGQPAAPAGPAGPAGMPQYTMGHWMIVMLDQQVHLTDAQKEQGKQLDLRYTAAVRNLQAQAWRNVLGEMTPGQREKVAKKFGQYVAWWTPNQWTVQMLDREVDLSGEQKERMNAVISRDAAKVQERQAAFNNDLMALLTPEQRDQYTHNAVYSGAWSRIAWLKPTPEQTAKFKAIMDEMIKGVNLADQKTRDEVTMKIYFIVRDTVLTDQQQDVLKHYPQAFYPDKPGMTYPPKPVAQPPAPRPPVGRPVPQYTAGGWMIQWMDREVHLTDAQKQDMKKLDDAHTAKLKNLQASFTEDVMAVLTREQREQWKKNHGAAPMLYPHGYMVTMLDRELHLAADQKEKLQKLCDQQGTRLLDATAEYNNSLLASATPQQRDQFSRNRLYDGVWNRIACVHPTAEQTAKFKAYMEEQIKGQNIADQKTRDTLALKIYYYVRDNVLTEAQLSFFKFYPNAFYPDKPDMKPVRPEPKK